MKTSKYFIVMLLIAVSYMGLILAQENSFSLIESDFISQLKTKSKKFFDAIPQDRVYVNTDKTIYEPGETIWMSANLVEASTMKESKKSQILHLDIYSPKGNKEKSFNLICRSGKASADYLLSQDCVGGIYKIKAYTNWQKNEPDSIFFEKEITVQEIIEPTLKMTLDFERKSYGSGDEVIAKLKVQNKQNEAVINFPFVNNVMLEGEKILEQNLSTGNDGEMYIKFNLPKKLKSSDVIINIQLNYQGNAESISRSIPIVLNAVNLSFFPEGGDLIAGLENNLAFKAVNEFNKPVDVEGQIKDSKNKVVTNFKTFHFGLGQLNFIPEEGEQYYAQITKPNRIDEQFVLPMSLNYGVQVKIENENENKISATINSTTKQSVSVIASIRDKIYFASNCDVDNTNKKFIIPTESMPMGVCKITIFNQENLPCCERLVFVNQNKQLSISIKTEKDKYLPREKVKATIEVKDANGNATDANISLAVTNDMLLSFADDKQGNLISELYLQQDLKEKVTESKFYFTEHPKAKKTLDLLMLTSGWRRFSYTPIIQNQVPLISYLPEQTVIEGTVLDRYTNKPLKGINIKIGNKVFSTNSTGRFFANNIDLSKKTILLAKAQGFEEYKEELTFYDSNKTIYLTDVNQAKLRAQNIREALLFENVVREDNAMMAAPAMNGAVNFNNQVKAVAQKDAEDHKMVKREIKRTKNLVPPNKANNKKEDVKIVAEPKVKFVQNNLAKAKMRLEDMEQDEVQVVQNNITYHIAREFPAVLYTNTQNQLTRSDFRSTLYWNPNLQIDETGKQEIEFYTGDDISSFCFVAEGISSNGLGGYAEKKIFTQLPFSIDAKFPNNFVQDDVVEIPLIITNNSSQKLIGNLNIVSSSVLEWVNKINFRNIEVSASSFVVIPCKFKAIKAGENEEFSAHYSVGNTTDGFSKNINVSPKGFPISMSFSGKETNANYTFDVKNSVPGSISASVTAYPSVVSDLLKGVEGILREPGGCFEQTSMSSYPNILVKEYLKTMGIEDAAVYAKANKMIDNGYKKLVSFETKEKGYEWFGGAPAHEALTAYGLLQFTDMKKVYGGVDNAMLDRTTKYLLASKDGNGGYKKNPRALDNFGGADKDITDAYITYAMAAAGFYDIEKEVNYSEEMSSKSNDAYMLGLTVNTLFDNKKTKRADALLKKLLALQNEDGSFSGKKHSITRSTGNGLKIETTSLAIMAMLKAENKNDVALNNAVEFVIKSRGGYGDFGNTQSTIMALKALTAYAQYSKQTNEDGTIECYINGNKAAEQFYKAGTRDAISINNLEEYLNDGGNKITLKYKNAKNPLPYSVNVSWYSTLPQSNLECAVNITTQTESKKVEIGQTLRLTAVLKNTTKEGLPSTMAIIGIPSNCSLQPWQLKEMQEKRVFDYYEIKENKLFVYYRQMAPSETKILNFDLKAEFKGVCQTPASCAYLYYTNELKCWENPIAIEVK